MGGVDVARPAVLVELSKVPPGQEHHCCGCVEEELHDKEETGSGQHEREERRQRGHQDLQGDDEHGSAEGGQDRHMRDAAPVEPAERWGQDAFAAIAYKARVKMNDVSHIPPAVDASTGTRMIHGAPGTSRSPQTASGLLAPANAPSGVSASISG